MSESLQNGMSTQQTISLAAKVLGGHDAVDFSQRIQSMATSGIRLVLIDMTHVEVMNSSGLGMLVAAHSTMLRFGGRLSFTHVPEKVKELLRMTHLDSVFHMSDADS